MKTKGIRILDIKNGKCIPLSELLLDIPQPNQYKWLLLWLDVKPMKGEGRFISGLTEKINHSDQGLQCTFALLLEISGKIFQEIEVLIIGSKIAENLHRYKEDQKMYEACDFVIEMIDGGFWEIFSTDINWINELTKKYKQVEFLTPDFQKKV